MKEINVDRERFIEETQAWGGSPHMGYGSKRSRLRKTCDSGRERKNKWAEGSKSGLCDHRKGKPGKRCLELRDRQGTRPMDSRRRDRGYRGPGSGGKAGPRDKLGVCNPVSDKEKIKLE